MPQVGRSWRKSWVGTLMLLFTMWGGCSSTGASGDDLEPRGRAWVEGRDASGEPSRGPADPSSGASDAGPPAPEAGPAAVAAGCRHLDIVFSIDPSGSMREELTHLRHTVFPAFAQELMRLPNVEDFRVGVLDACLDPPSFHTEGRAGECSFSSGQPWMTSDAADLAAEFSCVGDLYGEGDPGYGDVSNCTGSGSDNEHPATAALYAVEAAAGGANAGFLRDDAVLVVVAVTDEDEQPENAPTQPSLSAQDVFDRFVLAKGDPRAVAFLGVGGATECDGVYGSAEEAVMLKEITTRFAGFDRGLFWDLCGGRLEDGLSQVVDLIQRACDELPPPCDEFHEGSDTTDCYGQPDEPAPPPEEPPLI